MNRPYRKPSQTNLFGIFCSLTAMVLVFSLPIPVQAFTVRGLSKEMRIVYAHPSDAENAVVGWKSPVKAYISASGLVKDLNPRLSCAGHGIKWFIEKGSVDIACGSIPSEGGTQSFIDGTGGDHLSRIPVRGGEFLYFAVDPNGDTCADATQLDIHIQVVTSMASIYMPVVSKPEMVEPALSGTVTFDGSPASGVLVHLFFYNGTDWLELTSTTTAADGSYSFPNPPALSPGQKYYVRYFNNTDDVGKLILWNTKTLTAYDGASIIQLETFDIANINLVSPDPEAIVSLPATFTWTRRPATPSDIYDFVLFDPADWAPLFYTVPPLGYVSSYRLQSLPNGFIKGTLYGWSLYIYSPDGGFGIPYYYLVTFK